MVVVGLPAAALLNARWAAFAMQRVAMNLGFGLAEDAGLRLAGLNP